jgi:hypothetical protein
MFFGIVYVTTAYTLGHEAAKRALRFSFFLMLLLGLALALLYKLFGQEYGYACFAILSAVSINIRLISWLFRTQEAGVLLLDIGKTEEAVSFLVVALLQVVSISILTWQLFNHISSGFPESSSLLEEVSIVIFNLSIAIFFVSLGLNKLEFRENGICYLLNFIAWQKVQSYKWKHSKSNTLIILYNPQFPFSPGSMSVTIPAQHLEAVSHILNQQLPDKNL